MRSYAIGDIHGHLGLLKEVHGWIAEDRAHHADTTAPIVHIGDLVDRGPNCNGVIDYLMKGIEGGANWLVLKGNHDRMFSMFLDDPHRKDHRMRPEFTWLHPRIGGSETLASYGVKSASARPLEEVHAEALAAVPASHRAFMAGLIDRYRHGEVIFAHAGIRPGVPLADQTEDDLTWIRAEFLNDPRDHGALVVHGHSHIETATHYGNRVNIDSSAAYGGPLTGVVIEGRRVFRLGPDGRQELLPPAG